jgi:CubicO group peptidase (beta-lactamase class C family)
MSAIRTGSFVAVAMSAIIAMVEPSPIRAQHAAPSLDAETRRRIDAAFAAWDTTASPGCAVGISRAGTVVYARGYGMANLESDAAVSPDSIFHVASISKQFTAFSAALLAADGKLSLDDEVRKHLPEIPDFGKRITVRHLMHHTSGLRDQWTLQNYAGWREDDVITQADVLQMASRQRGLNFDPGAEYLYSNTGFTLLGAIVQRVSGQSLREFAEARIFAPLGMTRTHFHDDHTMIVRGRTSAYQPRADGGFRISIPVFDTDGATSLFTTVGDLLRWEQNFVDAKVGGRTLIEQAQVSGRLNDGSDTGYGWGLALGRYRGVRAVGHSGADAGYRADVVRFPDHDLAIATFCNLSTTNPTDLTRQVADVLLPSAALAPLHTAAAVSADTLKGLDGVYVNPLTDDVIRITLADGALRTGPTAPAFLAMGDGRFRTGPRGGELHFPTASPGAAQELHALSLTLPPVVFKRLPPMSAPPDLAAFAGRYRSADLDTTYELTVDGQTLVVRRPRVTSLVVTPIAADKFAGASGSPMVSFQRTGGQVTAMTISMGRVRRLPFTRVSGSSTTTAGR